MITIMDILARLFCFFFKGLTKKLAIFTLRHIGTPDELLDALLDEKK